MPVPIYETKVSKIVRETPHTKTLYIDVPEEFTFKPGQFVMALFELDGKEERRAYSISTSPDDNKLGLTIKGDKLPSSIGLTIKLEPEGKGGSIRLHEFNEGDPIKVQGPFGMFTVGEEQHSVMIAAGSGIAPFRSMWRFRNTRKLGTTDVLMSAPDKDGMIFYDEMNEVMHEHGEFNAYFTITRNQPEGWTHGNSRIDLDTIKENTKNYEQSTFYLCGAPQFCEAMRSLLLNDGIPKEQVKMEKYW